VPSRLADLRNSAHLAALKAHRRRAVPARKEAEAVLATWREIERALEKAEPGSLEHERLTADAHLLRDEYQRLVAELQADDELPAMSESRGPV
jgi:hypothetical protein